MYSSRTGPRPAAPGRVPVRARPAPGWKRMSCSSRAVHRAVGGEQQRGRVRRRWSSPGAGRRRGVEVGVDRGGGRGPGWRMSRAQGGRLHGRGGGPGWSRSAWRSMLRAWPIRVAARRSWPVMSPTDAASVGPPLRPLGRGAARTRRTSRRPPGRGRRRDGKGRPAPSPRPGQLGGSMASCNWRATSIRGSSMKRARSRARAGVGGGGGRARPARRGPGSCARRQGHGERADDTPGTRQRHAIEGEAQPLHPVRRLGSVPDGRDRLGHRAR